MKNNKKRFFLMLATIAIFIMSFSGCTKEQDDIKNYVAKEEGEYTIYYMSDKKDNVYSYVYESNTTDDKKLVGELVDELKKGDYSGAKEAVITKELSDVSVTINNKGIITMYFPTVYQNMEGIQETLFRACVVKTLCQVESIIGVEFYVGDKPLAIIDGKVIDSMDNEDGNQNEASDENAENFNLEDANVGVMNSYDFVNNIGDVSNSEQHDIVTLYYANEDGSMLESSFVGITYDNTISREELVVSQLFEEPDSDMCHRAINENTKINKISTKDNVCYLDLSKDILNPPENVDLEVSIYSIVNSLVDLDTVTKVQILVDGEVLTEFSEDGMMERNFNIILGE